MESKQTRGGPTANCRDNTNWFDPGLLKGKEIFMTVRHTDTHTQIYMYTYIFVCVNMKAKGQPVRQFIHTSTQNRQGEHFYGDFCLKKIRITSNLPDTSQH